MGWFESQIETRAKYDAIAVERAYEELAASVSDSKRAPVFTVDDIEQADGAAIACLKHIGVEPGHVPDGVKDIDQRIEWLCRPTGTMRRAVRLEKDWFVRAFGAMVGRLDTGQAIALLPRGLSGYYYLQPGTGRKIKVTRQVAEHIDCNAMLFYRPLPAKPLTVRDLISFVFRVFDRGDYLLVFAAAMAVTLIGLAPAWANEVAYGVVAPSGQLRLIMPVAALLLGMAVSTALIGASRNLVMARVSAKLNVVTEAATFARVLSLPTSFFKQYSSGNLASRVSNMTMLMEQISDILLGSGLSALLSLVYILQIGVYAPALAPAALAIVVIQAVLTVVVTFVTSRYERVSMEASAKLSGTVTALLNGIQKIKLAGAEGRAFSKWARGYADYARATYNRPTLLRALPALVALVGLLGNICIYFFAGSTRVTVANYMAFNAAYGQVTAAIMAIAGIAGQIAKIGPMLDMVSPILKETPETAEDKPSVESLSGGCGSVGRFVPL